ncbi:helix-turn-helix domain-containing protein [Lentilactobacillus parabuchneri]|uniref:helix-turn-helix domain-containing protein n=1 Tax=Lentilactobacillus parabuchneri TaxID=152331 RepID=UPI0031D90307
MKYTDEELDYRNWRFKQFESKKGFFPVFTDFQKYFGKISPGAITLFMYMGVHSNNRFGTMFFSIDRMATDLNKTPRTISSWIKELEDTGLIARKQNKFNSVSVTYLKPY